MRLKLLLSNTYKLIIPPMISIIPIQEYNTIDDGFSSVNEKKYFMVDKDKLSMNSTLRLKRSKPFYSNKGVKDSCITLVDDEVIVSEDLKVAETFNTFFDNRMFYIFNFLYSFIIRIF